MLDKNARLVYTFRERKSRGLQTAAAGPCLQKISKSKTENYNKGGKECPKQCGTIDYETDPPF